VCWCCCLCVCVLLLRMALLLHGGASDDSLRSNNLVLEKTPFILLALCVQGQNQPIKQSLEQTS
jgi:hypothetical protein